MNKITFSLAAAMLLLMSFVPGANAQNFAGDTVGTWTLFVTFNGAPPCQCIEITRFNADGTIAGPANDHFSGDVFGIWKQTGYREATVALVQNAINADGSAGGEYMVRFTMSLNPQSDQGTGSGTFQLLDNGGKQLASGTFTFKATKLTIP